MSSIRSLRSIVFIASSTLLAQGCAASTSTSEEEASTTITDPLAVSTANVWLSRDIPVCWETPGYATEKAWVREAVHRSWEIESGIEFTGWGDCTPTTKGIRIRQANDTPASGVGRDPVSENCGMNLKFSFEAGSWCAANRQACIQNHATHEFGHALGFPHEHNRDDHPDTCLPTPGESGGDLKIGAFDMGSVMNYCSNIIDWLSPTDIQGVQQIYGNRRPVSAASWGPSRVDAVFTSKDGNVYTKSFESAWVAPQTNLLGPISGGAGLVSMYDNRLDLFARGTDGSLYTKSWTGTAWNSFAMLGSQQVVGNPVAVSMYKGRIDLFVRAPDNRLLSPGTPYVPSANLLTKSWNGTSWSGYTNLGGNITGEPAVITRGGDKIDILARGRDGRV